MRGQIPSGNLGLVETILPHLALMMAIDDKFSFFSTWCSQLQNNKEQTRTSFTDWHCVPEPTAGPESSRVRSETRFPSPDNCEQIQLAKMPHKPGKKHVVWGYGERYPKGRARLTLSRLESHAPGRYSLGTAPHPPGTGLG